MQLRLNQYRKILNIPLQEKMVLPEDPVTQFARQMDVILSNDVSVFSFTFGIPEKKYIQALKAKKIIIIGTATNCVEAEMLEQAGCDLIAAQGYEAGRRN
jgi:nitronate monooxygenase